MGISRIRLYNYRNLHDAEVDVDAPEVFLVGENGQGKTNFLESVYLLCFASSFRARLERDLIRHGEREMSVSGRYTVGADPDEQSVAVKLEGERKRVEVNGKPISDRKQLIENIPCIVFCHEDIEFVSGPPERRRWFFNQTMSLHTSVFIDLLRRYNRVLSMRNAALKDNRLELLDVYDQQAAAAGFEIQEQRKTIITQFNKSFSPLFSRVSGLPEQVEIRYVPSWKGAKGVEDALRTIRKRRDTDCTMRTTTSGPHRDRIGFYAAGRDFADVASTGQLRLMSLVLRVAQARFFSQVTGKKPVLLLDDVLLELDSGRRRRFLDELPAYEQTFFTFLPDEQYHGYRGPHTRVFGVSAGRLEPVA